MNKDNKAIFENFAASRQQIVSEEENYWTANALRNVPNEDLPEAEENMPARPNPAVDNADPSTLTRSEPARPNPAVDNADPSTLTEPYSLEQFRQMSEDGTLGKHLSNFGTAEEAAEYLSGIKKEYDERGPGLGLPPSDSPESPFAQGEKMARASFPKEYDNAKESIASRGDVDPEAVGPELDFKDNEVAPVARPNTKEDNWATRIGAKEIPPVPTGADTPNGGQPGEAPPAADMSGVNPPGVTNTQDPIAPIEDFNWNQAHNSLDTDNSGYLNDDEAGPGGTSAFLDRFSALAKMPEAEDDGSLPYLTPGGQELTKSLNNLDPKEQPVMTQPLPEDPTISNTIDAGGDPTDPTSRDYTNNKDYAGTNEAPRQIAPEVPQTSDVPGQNGSSAAPDIPAPRSIAPPAAKSTSPPRSTGTTVFDWIKNKNLPAPSSQFDDAAKGKGFDTRFGEGPVTPYPGSPMSKPMPNPYDSSRIGLNQPAPPADPNPSADDPYGVKAAGTPEDFAANETEPRPSAEQEYDNAMADAGDVSTPGNEQWAYNKSGKQAEKKYYRDATRKFDRDRRTQGYKNIYNAQKAQLASDRKEMAGMDLDELYARRDALEKEQRAQRKEQRARREERRADRAGRNKPKPDTNGDIEGVDYQEPAARSAAEAEAQIQSGDRARELDRSRELQAQKAAQTKPNRPQSTPTPPATAQKPGIGRKLMSFLPGGEKPSEVFGKHAGREGANAAVRGTNHQKSFKDHNAEMNAQRQAKADEQAAKKQAVKSQAGTLGKTTTPPTSRTTDKKPPTVGQNSSATPADSQKKKGGFLSGFKVAKTPSTSRPGQGRFGRGVKR